MQERIKSEKSLKRMKRAKGKKERKDLKESMKINAKAKEGQEQQVIKLKSLVKV